MSHRQCPECEGALVCAEHGEVQRPLVAPCPAKRGGLWVLVHDKSGLEVSGVTVKVGGQRATTDATGLAAFDPIDDGSYTAELEPLSGEVAKHYALPVEPRVGNLTVAHNKVLRTELVLRRRPTLKVKLSSAVAAKITLHGDGDGDGTRSESTKDGTVDFGTVSPGRKEIEVQLEADVDAKDVKRQEVSPDYDEDIEVPIEVKAPPVNPVIEHDGDAILAGRRGLMVTLKADAPFQGKGQLRLIANEVNNFDVLVGGIDELADGVVDFPDIDENGVVVELYAVEPTALDGVKLEWELQGDNVGPARESTLTAVKATLSIDDVHGVPLAPRTMRAQGRTLVKCDAEGRRAKVTVTCEPAEYGDRLRLRDPSGAGHLRLHDDAEGEEALGLPHAFQQQGPWPAELYVEGIEPSANASDDRLQLVTDDGVEIDVAVITVVEATLELFGPRPEGGEPLPLPADQKRDPGRSLVAQSWDLAHPRAMVRVRVQPLDSPCRPRLVSSGPALRLYTDEAPLEEGAAAGAAPPPPELLPRTIGANEITDAEAGLVRWAELDGTASADAPTSLSLELPGAVEGPVDEVGFSVDHATLKVAVARRDGADLSGAVTVELRSEAGAPVLFAGTVPAGGHEVELKVPPTSYVIGIVTTAGSQEEDFRILRDPLAVEAVEPEEADNAAEAEAATEAKAAEARVRVALDEETTVSYELAPAYTRIQLVGYQVWTGTDTGMDMEDPSAPYADETEQEAARETASKDDLEARCTLMKKAVQRAHEEALDEDDVLKVFMAPEFYFRGTRGAYPIEMLSQIPAKMREEIKDPKYRDWLFVFGTAIGRIKSTERVEYPATHVEVDLAESEVMFRYECAAASRVANAMPGWRAHLSAKPGMFNLLAKAGITNTKHLGTFTIHRMMAPEDHPMKPDTSIMRVHCRGIPRFSVGAFKLSLEDPTDPKHSKHPVSKRRASVTAHVYLRSARPPEAGWHLEQGARSVGVIGDVTPVGPAVPGQPQRYKVLVNYSSGVLPEDGLGVTIATAPRAEIFNVAFVQQGGEATSHRRDGGQEHRDLIVYKERISSIDFQGREFGTFDFEEVSRHRGDIDGEDVALIPTAGARGTLGSYPNEPGQPLAKPPTALDPETTAEGTGSEVSKSGIGGGCVFTKHDIVFGLEVCLDHAVGRLLTYDGDEAEAGDRRVQVHLIPSAGMAIDPDHCLPNTMVFNVDSVHTVARLNGGTGPNLTADKYEAPVPADIERAHLFPSLPAAYAADDGHVHVFAPQATPAKALVP